MMMKKFDVHVCTISNELTPNFIPAIHEEFMPKALVLLVSLDMTQKAEQFKSVMQDHYPNIRIHTLKIDDIYNMDEIKTKVNDYIETYIEDHENAEKQIVLNTTGGTKLISFELLSLFNSWGLDSFYFKIENSEVLYLNQYDDKDKTPQKDLVLIPKKIDLAGYLKLHDHEIDSTEEYEANPKKQALFQELITYSDCYQAELSHLNFEINKVADSILEIPLSNATLSVIDLFVQAGVCRLKGKTLVFDTKKDKNFVRGGWFEEYVYSAVLELDKIQALKLGVQIKSAAENVKKPNELDVSFMRGNRLHIIECKTANYETGQAKKEGTKDLNKLKTFDALGGRSTRLAFVSYFKVSPDMRDRAKGNHIEMIDGRNIQGLKKILDKWSCDA